MPKIEDLIKNGVNTYSYYQPEEKPPEDGNFVRGFKRAMYQVPETLGGTAALVGDVVGADGLRDYGMSIYEKNHAKSEELTKASDSLTSVLEGEEGANVGDFLSGSAGYVAGQAATALATGGVGGFIGSQLAKRGIKSLAEKGVESVAAKMAAEKAAATGAKIGAGTALFGSNVSQEAGSIYPEALAQAEKEGRTLDGGDKARIIGSALAAAGVETAADALMLKGVLKGGRKAGEGLGKAALREVPGAMGREAATEGVQTGIERYGAGQELTTAEAIRDYVDSMGVGAVGGGLGGGASVLHAQKVPESGPMTRAANTSIDEKILQLAHDPQPLISFPDGSVGHKQDMEAYLTQFTDPEERQAKERELMGRDPKTGKRIEPEPAPEPVSADSEENSKANIKAWSDKHDAVTLDYAQNLLKTPGAKGLDLMIAPHASGKGYTVIPSKWMSLDAQAKSIAIQNGDEGRLPSPDREAPSGRMLVDSEGGAAKETYGDQSRTAAAVKKSADEEAAAAARREELGTPVPYGKAVSNTRGGKDGTRNPSEPESNAGNVENAGGQQNGNQEAVPGNNDGRGTGRIPEQSNVDGNADIDNALILNPKGQPFVTEFAAKRKLKADKLGETHEVVPTDGGFVVQRKPAAEPDLIDQAAHEAATSPQNDMPQPTEAQKNAGNYKVGKIKLHGLDISIENPAGSTRSGVDKAGKPWENKLAHHYGYIRGTEGADNDHVDTFIGSSPDSDRVYIVNQTDPDTGAFDETKVMLGFNSLKEAKAAYKANYEKNWKGGKNVSETSVEGFKAWLKDGDTKQPYNAQTNGGNDENKSNIQGRSGAVQRGSGTASAGNLASGNENIGGLGGSANAITERQAEATAKPQVERRKDSATRKAVDDMTPAEMRQALLTDDLTQLGNRRAYEESDKKQFQASIDIDSLKWVNDNMGHASGDQLIRLIGRALKEQTQDAYHLSGDEFVAQFNNEDAGKALLESVRDRLKGATIEITRPDGTVVTKTGLEFSYGIAPTLNEADTKLAADKTAREASGQRAGRGEQPAGISERPAKGQQDNEGDAAANQALAGETPAELIHNGTRIYRTMIRSIEEGKPPTAMWAVESVENKEKRETGKRAGMGDSLHDSLEKAKEAADTQRARDEENKASQREQEEAEGRRSEEDAARKSDTYNGFLDGKPENVKALIRKALDKQYRFDGVAITVRQRIESLEKSGTLSVRTFEEPKIKPMSRAQSFRANNAGQDAHEKKMREAGNKTVYLVDGSDIGKTAYDYASHLLSEKSAITPDVKTAPEPAGKPKAKALQERAKKIKPKQEAKAEPSGDEVMPNTGAGAKSVTETAAFRKWFGDSKVVDKDGKPLVVYHGTADDFSAFEKDKPGKHDGGWLGEGFYFTTDAQLAGSYSNLKSGSTPNVMPVYLSIKNPYKATRRDKERLMLADHRGDKQAIKDWTDDLKAQGYDGVELDYSSTGWAAGPREFVAFDPTQIKSATGNNGNFDPGNPSIVANAGSDTQSGAKDFDKKLYDDIGAGKSSADLLQSIAKESTSPMHRELAQALIDAGVKSKIEHGSAAGKKFDVKRLPAGLTYAAGFAPNVDTVMLFQAEGAEKNILHELVHAATHKAVKAGGIMATQMKALYHHVNRSGEMADMYGMENHDEFVAEALSNPGFQDKLRGIKAMPEGSRFANAWNWFTDLVRRAIGLPTKHANALEQALRFGRGMMEENKAANADADGDVKAAINLDTSAFKKWFGDSKVVDGNGKPLVVYHGTVEDFDVFETGKNPFSVTNAFYFTPRPEATANYSAPNHSSSASRVMPVYLAISNPYLAKNYMEIGRLSSKRIKELRAQGFDGAYFKSADPSLWFQEEWAAFDSNQIKSATGNNGNFDPGNPNIMANVGRAADSFLGKLGVQQEMRNTVSDLFQSEKTFNGWWHKSIGTQYHKAQIDHHFKRVYDSVQRYLSTVSSFANEAADRAPTLLPKLEGLRDLAKKPPSKADTEAAGRAIFEGTLNDNKVYSDDELRDKYKLTQPQIDLYREFRAAADKSIDDMGKTDILRYAGADGAHLTNAVMAAKDVAAGAKILTEHLNAIKEEDSAKVIQAKADRFEQLKAQGYAPLMRFGEHTVYVTDKNGHQIFFGMAETGREAAKLARDMKETYPDATVTQGILSSEGAKLFAGISPDTIEVFAQTTGLDKNPLFQDYLKLVVNNRSALKRLIERKGIAGFSQDTTRVLASFLTSNARASSKNLHGGEMTKAANDIPKEKGDVKDEAIRLVDYIQNPVEEAAKIRGLLFTNFIGGSIASAAVNLTQPVMMTLPYLAQFGGAAKAAATLAGAMKMAATITDSTKIADPDLRAAMIHAEKEGIVSPQEIHQLQAEAQRSSRGFSIGGKEVVPAIWMRRAQVVWGGLFGLAEQFNRRVTFIAAYQTAKTMTPAQFEKAGVADAAEFAAKAIAETQGVYNRGNKPDWARGALGSTLMTFKQYSISYIEFLKRLPPKERALALGILVVAAGANGLPFADDLDDVIDTIGQALGYNFNTKKAKQRFATNILGEDAANFVLHGFSGVGGLPLDVSMRMGMGNLLPGTGLLMKSEADKSHQMSEFFGAAGGYGQKVLKAGDKLLSGDPAGALMAMASTAVTNAAKAVDMMQTDAYRDSRGRKVMDTDMIDAIVKGIGFQPSNVAKEQEKLSSVRQDIAMANAVKAEIADKWAQGVFEKDPQAAAKAREAIRKWNDKNPDSPINVTMAQIAKRVHAMRTEKQARMIKSAPKSMRTNIREEMEPQ